MQMYYKDYKALNSISSPTDKKTSKEETKKEKLRREVRGKA